MSAKEEDERQLSMDLGRTFRDSKNLAIHGWYPYVEGFSASYVAAWLDKAGNSLEAVYDPFGGSGTVQLEASRRGVRSFYSEINPFMAFVADTKVNAAQSAMGQLGKFKKAAEKYISALSGPALASRARSVDLTAYNKAFPKRDFFVEQDIRYLLAARDLGIEVAEGDPIAEAIFTCACAANAVKSSNMTRRADLRRRRPDEYKLRVVDVAGFVLASVEKMLADITLMAQMHGSPQPASTTFASADCRLLPPNYNGKFDFAITSPPYLNGTNYFRNTKIELWLLGFIKSEAELPSFTSQAIAGGINNISRSKSVSFAPPAVEAAAKRLEAEAPDKRIPKMVRQYFSDMHEVFRAVQRGLKPNGRFVLDVGDSKFYGVHVPTDQILIQTAEAAGLEIEASSVIARRYSRDRSPLIQVELVFRKG